MAFVLVAGAAVVLAACSSGSSSSPTTRASSPPTTAARASTTTTGAAPKNGLPPIRHVFVIVLENEGYENTFGTPSADPYLAGSTTGSASTPTSTTSP